MYREDLANGLQVRSVRPGWHELFRKIYVSIASKYINKMDRGLFFKPVKVGVIKAQAKGVDKPDFCRETIQPKHHAVAGKNYFLFLTTSTQSGEIKCEILH